MIIIMNEENENSEMKLSNDMRTRYNVLENKMNATNAKLENLLKENKELKQRDFTNEGARPKTTTKTVRESYAPTITPDDNQIPGGSSVTSKSPTSEPENTPKPSLAHRKQKDNNHEVVNTTNNLFQTSN